MSTSEELLLPTLFFPPNREFYFILLLFRRRPRPRRLLCTLIILVSKCFVRFLHNLGNYFSFPFPSFPSPPFCTVLHRYLVVGGVVCQPSLTKQDTCTTPLLCRHSCLFSPKMRVMYQELDASLPSPRLTPHNFPKPFVSLQPYIRFFSSDTRIRCNS